MWIAGIGCLTEWLGFHWDIAWHGDRGRDTFFTPPHAMIVSGILVTFVAGASVILGRLAGRPIRERIEREPGAALVTLGGVLTGTTLVIDNAWHGRFGTDVAVWSPPHLMLGVSFLIAALGVIVEFARRQIRPGRLATMCGGFLAISTILLVEYDFGYPHFRILWSPIALAFLLGLGLGLSWSVSRHRWAGTIMGASALLLRLLALGLNAAMGRSLSVPPIGILAGGIAFDLVRARIGRVRAAVPSAVVAGWLAAFLVQVPWLRAVGKTWWVDGILPAAAVAGLAAALFGAVLGASIGARMEPSSLPHGDGSDRRRRRLLRALVAGALLSAIFSASTYQFVGGYSVRMATYDARRPTFSLSVPGSSSKDWVSVIGPRDPLGIFRSTPAVAVRPLPQVLDSLELSWLGGLGWHDGAFRGNVKGAGELVLVWYVGGDSVWAGLVQRGTAGTIPLIRQAFHPQVSVAPWMWVVGIGVIVLMVEIAFGATVLVLERTRRLQPS